MNLLLSFLMSCIVFLSSCDGNDATDIVKKKYLSSDALDAEWFSQAVLVEKQTHSNFGFSGMQCGLERVRFQVEGDRLLAFKSFSKSQPHSSKDQAHNLVAAFQINRVLRLKDKKYFDIDWSRNLVPHLECNGWLQSITSAYIDNSRVAAEDPYPVRINKEYMETTVNAMVEPQEKACSLSGQPQCGSALYRVKFSFKKITPSDYQKRLYPDFETFRYGFKGDKLCLEGQENCDNLRELWLYSDAQKNRTLCDPLKDNLDDCYAPNIKMNAQFGFFRTEIFDFRHTEGFREHNYHQYINRRNIWQKSVDKNGVIIPLKERIPKKVVYYLNPGFPSELYETTQMVAKEWSLALANVVAKLKDQCTFEAVLTAQKQVKNRQVLAANGIDEVSKNNYKDACTHLYNATKNTKDKVFFTGKAQEIIDYYGDLFEIRINDCNSDKINEYLMRHNMTNLLKDNGLNIHEEDALENVCALIAHEGQKLGYEPFLWQQPGDIRYSFVNGVKKPESVGLLGYGPSSVDPLSGEIISAHANIYLSTIKDYAARSVLIMEKIDALNSRNDVVKKTSLHEKNVEEIHAIFNGVHMSSFSLFSPTQPMAYFKDNLDKFSQIHDTNSLSQKEIDEIMSFINHQDKQENMHHKTAFYGERSACFLEMAQSLPYERLRTMMRDASREEKIARVEKLVVKSVLLHEIGHTLGLRHNFKGAKDPLNYPPQFWGASSEGLENRPGFQKEELRSASIMDYHKYFNSDFSGLGMYDYAALLFGYAEKVEVFDEEDGAFVPRTFIENLGLMDYHDYPALFAGPHNEVEVISHISAVRDAFRRGRKTVYLNIKKLGLENRPENIFKRKYIDYDKIKENTIKKLLTDKKNNFTVVPYGFCTDGQIHGNDILCRPFIYGATPSELVRDAIKNYDQALLLRKINVSNSTPASVYMNAIYNQVYAPFLHAFQLAAGIKNNSLKIYPLYHDCLRATNLGFNLISQVLQSVDAGEYCKDDHGYYISAQEIDECYEKINIDNHSGKYVFENIKNDKNSVDFMSDKIIALFALVNGQSLMKNQPASASISLYHVFRPQLLKLFGDFYTDHWQSWAPSVQASHEGKTTIEHHDIFFTTENNVGSKIKPSFSQKLKDYAMLFSMAGLSSPGDYRLDFSEQARIGILGRAHANMDPGIETITFQDPLSGITYQAYAGSEKGFSIGYLLLKDAKEFIGEGQNLGPWLKAKTDLADARKNWEQSRLFAHTDAQSPSDLEKRMQQTERQFQVQHKILKEKLRVIHKVFRWSNKL